MKTIYRMTIAVLIAAAGAVAAARAEDAARSATLGAGGASARVLIATTTELAAAAEALAEGFRRHHPGVEANVVSGRGDPLPDSAIADAPAPVVLSHASSPQQLEAIATTLAHPPVGAVLAADAVAVFVHKNNPVRQLTLPQLDALFSADRRCGYKTSVSVWGDLGLTGAWAQARVRPFAPSFDSDTAEYVRQQALCGGAYEPTLTEMPTGAEIVAAVGTSIHGVGLASVTQGSPGVRAVPIARRGTESITIGKWLIESHGIPTPDTEAFAPTAENIRLARYPLSRPVYLYVTGEVVRGSQAAAELVRYLYSAEAQELLAAMGYVPLPANVAADGLRRLGLQ